VTRTRLKRTTWQRRLLQQGVSGASGALVLSLVLRRRFGVRFSPLDNAASSSFASSSYPLSPFSSFFSFSSPFSFSLSPPPLSSLSPSSSLLLHRFLRLIVRRFVFVFRLLFLLFFVSFASSSPSFLLFLLLLRLLFLLLLFLFSSFFASTSSCFSCFLEKRPSDDVTKGVV
jgi:hypothetical protein